MDVDKLISKLQTEIVKTQEGLEQTEQLDRLRQVALVYKGDDKVVPFREVYDRILNRPPVSKMYTGWQKLDELLAGFRKRQLIIVSGIMKHGKTSFTIDMSQKLSDKHIPLWLALEESIEELMEKSIERGEEPMNGFGPENATFVKTDWVEQKIVEGIVKYGCDIVFIDNIDFLRPVENNKNDKKNDRVEQVAREIKLLAKKWNVTIVLIVHVTKSSKADSNPTFEDLKDSVAIGQLADKLIIVWRETNRGNRGELEINNNVNVSVQLNRQGKTGNIKMVYNNGHFIEEEWELEQSSLANF